MSSLAKLYYTEVCLAGAYRFHIDKSIHVITTCILVTH